MSEAGPLCLRSAARRGRRPRASGCGAQPWRRGPGPAMARRRSLRRAAGAGARAGAAAGATLSKRQNHCGRPSPRAPRRRRRARLPASRRELGPPAAAVSGPPAALFPFAPEPAAPPRPPPPPPLRFSGCGTGPREQLRALSMRPRAAPPQTGPAPEPAPRPASSWLSSTRRDPCPPVSEH